MPKRSNQFQQLITYVTGQLAPLGASVRESVELEEQGVPRPIKREVDVLIELDAGLSPVRVGIECRDRGRLDDIQWVDGLIGKYANLPVNQVIAVSSSGFSETARAKAELNNIRLMSLEEASETDWPAQFHRLGMLQVSQTYSVQSVSVELDPTIAEPLSADTRVILRSSDQTDGGDDTDEATLGDLINSVRDEMLAKARAYVSTHALEVFKTVADLDKIAIIEQRLPIQPGLFLHTAAGSESQIKAIILTVVVQTTKTHAEVRRHVLSDKAMVTSAVIAGDEPGIELKISAVQVSGKREGKVFIERHKPKR
jgi:hypothetical protein